MRPTKSPNGTGPKMPGKTAMELRRRFAEERLEVRRKIQPVPLEGKELEEYLENARKPETARAIAMPLAKMDGIGREDAERIIRQGISTKGLPPKIVHELTAQRLKAYDSLKSK